MPEAHDSRGVLAFDDAGGDTRWMSYAELGLARGISTTSATRLASRRKWRRQPGNDGTARVAVPVAEATHRTGRVQDASDDVARLVSGLEAALSTLQEQLERERSRADQAEEAVEQSALRLEGAESQIAKLQSAAETAALLRDALETALTAEERARRRAEADAASERAARTEAEAAAEALRQVEQTRRDLGRLARLRAAWRDGGPSGSRGTAR
jgi:predicted  nucleic acid-binding Zn-ribbon protein